LSYFMHNTYIMLAYIKQESVVREW